MSAPKTHVQTHLAGASELPLPTSLPVPFTPENLQHLSAEEAIQCQSMLGHGNSLGVWDSPIRTFGHVDSHCVRIDIRARLQAFLPESLSADPAVQPLLDEAVLYLTRYALLLRLVPTSTAKHKRNQTLKASTVAQMLYAKMPAVIARGIERRFGRATSVTNGFACALLDEDRREFGDTYIGVYELNRMARLTGQGLWPDEPRRRVNGTTTSVKGEKAEASPERKREPWQPLHDEYMEQIGPRVLWLIKDLGPNHIHLLNYLVSVQEERQLKQTESIGRYVNGYFNGNVWRDRHGHEIKYPPFPLQLSVMGNRRNSKKDAHAWPPRDYADVMSLAATVQRAHVFMALLLMTSRHSEIGAMKRDCVEVAADGKTYANGKTYKATKLLEGKDREWPAPGILVQSFAQQVELVQAAERLVRLVADARSGKEQEVARDPSPASEPLHLWASLGVSGRADATASLNDLGYGLLDLARSVGVDDKPGGINLHPHRLRKTMARLVGVALDGSQKVVMLLLGHEDVRTSLYYMQTDPGFRQEVEDVIREIRIIRSAKTIESMHAALHEPGSLAHAGHGGGGAGVLEQAIVQHEERLHRTGKRWSADSARELAAILTDNGNSSRLIAPGVLCTKSAGEVGMCTQKRGEVSPGNCKVECPSHIELAVGRRDVQRVIPILVRNTKTYVDEGEWLTAAHSKRQLVHELSRFDDIGNEFRAKPEVQAVLDLDPEGGP